MIDLHTHFLPGVDDGAQTLDEGLALARMAVADGIHVAVMTPHVHPGRYENRLSNLRDRFAAFRGALADAGIPLEIRLAGEVRLGMEALTLLLEGDLPILGEVDGYRVMLLEFPHQTLPVGTQQFIEKLLKMRVRPLIAHPERNKAVMLQPERLGLLLDAGCWLQLTAGSLTGRFGESARKTAQFIVRNRWAHVIATDSHNAAHRPPALAEGHKVVAELVDVTYANQLVQDNPARILGVS